MRSKLSITLVALLALGLVIPGLTLAPQHVFAGGDDDDDDCGSLLAVFDEDTDMLAGIITIIYNIIMTFMVNNNNI